MELKNKVLVKVALFVFLLGVTATVDARFDPASFINEVLPNGDGSYYVKSTTKACCNKCICTKSFPPICHCADVGETCHSACKGCICNWSIPPQCSCVDRTDFCYDPCYSSEADAEAH
ncbi:Bowman-Birk type proteinase inhibitor-like [Gastrolobium bilobum]|uniref:Bowman-Birk type proteinase inhibitor-like n=1 Tax=Gastrolobium bilobum TaxID=150636 RepID=UPI002AB29054|nr:Bowman-Birk type proteinase inhibitor-like [Gastrolobium bilobum]